MAKQPEQILEEQLVVQFAKVGICRGCYVSLQIIENQ